MPLKPLQYVLPAGGVVLSGAVGVAAYTAHALNGTRRRRSGDTFTYSPWEVQVPFQPVDFQSADGLSLKGWWFPRAETNRVIIGCTGHRGAKHELLGIGSGLWRTGSNVLLFDFRGCGESEAAPGSVAHKELPDARGALRFALQRVPGARVGMIGYSMGGAIAILVAADDPSVRAVVADSSFATIRDVVAHAYRRRRIPAQPILALTDAVNRWRYGYGFSAVRPIDVVGRIAPRSLLIIHGSDDMLTPVDHAYRLFAAAGEPKSLWIAPGTGHCGAYFVDRPAYVDRVAEFFRDALA